MCPKCKSKNVIKKGKYRRQSDNLEVRKFYCKSCFSYYSDQTSKYTYRLRKRRINQLVYRLLCKGVSQRGSAFVLGVKQETIARRIDRFGAQAKRNLAHLRASSGNLNQIMLDEMESFEHTKLKPLTMPIAVDEKTRKILALSVGKIAAKATVDGDIAAQMEMTFKLLQKEG